MRTHSLILNGQSSVSTSHIENGPHDPIYQALKNLENTAGEPRKIRVLNEGRGCQIQQPRAITLLRGQTSALSRRLMSHSYPLGSAQWRSFGVDCDVCLLADVSFTENRETFRVYRHDATFDSVVDHLDEVAGAVWAACR